MEKLVSIILPVYGVQDHVEKCMHSLLSQDYENIQYVVVDDCSPDNSISIIKSVAAQYPERKDAVQVVAHEANKGLPAARNTGLEYVEGEYVFHCDSDDWVEATMVTDLVDAIEKNEADIAYCDFYLSFHKNERYMKQPGFQNPEECIRSMLSGKMKFNVWNKLVKADLYKENRITFPDGRSMGEDMTMFRLFCHARKTAYVPKAYYHYMQTNPNAFTKRMSSQQREDVLWNTEQLMAYLEQHKGTESFKEERDYFKLNMKLPFLISMDKELYNLWREWFPEANYAIGRNKDYSLRIRCVQYAALYKQDWLVKLYNVIVVKFIYGIIYR